MTLVILIPILVAGVILSAWAGPWLIRASTPALMRVPRFTVLVLMGTVFAWLGAILAIGPLIAWMMSGPVLVPGHVGEVCQRCIAASNPFSSQMFHGTVPQVVLIAIPAIMGLILASLLFNEFRRSRSKARAETRILLSQAKRIQLLGFHTWLISSSEAFAFSLSGREGGITISTGTLERLSREELEAVLRHEHAHLSQSHHVITFLNNAFGKYLHWIPLVSQIVNVLPHYLEICADDAARRHTGTIPLVGALLKLSKPMVAAEDGSPLLSALHMAGPQRIQHLVQPFTGNTGRAAISALFAHTFGLVSVGIVIYVPYILAFIQGCS